MELRVHFLSGSLFTGNEGRTIIRYSGLGRDDAPLGTNDAGAHCLLTFTEVVADPLLIVAEVFRDFAADLPEPFEVVGVGLCVGCAHGSMPRSSSGVMSLGVSLPSLAFTWRM